MSTQLRKTEDQIERIKRELLTLGPMRPGSITQQYRLPKERRRPFYQVSYTHRMRSRSEYVRPENIDALRKETANFRRFKTLIARWVDLALAASQLRVRQAVKTSRHAP
jgi:hypothetical protein